jgi:putative addiction module component (TIGR02574 family)
MPSPLQLEIPFREALFEGKIHEVERRKSIAMPTVTEQFRLENLTDDQRLQLIEELWESLTTNKTVLPLTDWQKAELDRRMAMESEQTGRPWSEILEELRQKP